jgi:hypothetical protein
LTRLPDLAGEMLVGRHVLDDVVEHDQVEEAVLERERFRRHVGDAESDPRGLEPGRVVIVPVDAEGMQVRRRVAERQAAGAAHVEHPDLVGALNKSGQRQHPVKKERVAVGLSHGPGPPIEALAQPARGPALGHRCLGAFVVLEVGAGHGAIIAEGRLSRSA